MPLRLRASLVCLLAALACGKTTEIAVEDPDPADVLYARGLEILEGERYLGIIPRVDYESAIATFQTLIDNYPYSEFAVLSELRIADAYFDNGKYEEALSFYRDFGDLHPQHERVPYTIYRSALCHVRRTRPDDRDQTPTREALVHLDRLLAEHPYSDHAAEGEELWRELRLKLARQILKIGDFYRFRGEYEAAAERYRALLSEYPGLGLDAQALFKLGLCYASLNRWNEAERLFQAVLQNYRHSDEALAAESRLRERGDG